MLGNMQACIDLIRCRRPLCGIYLICFAEYLIGKVEGAPPPFKPGGQPAAQQLPEAAEGEQQAAAAEAGEDVPALQKGKLLKARR